MSSLPLPIDPGPQASSACIPQANAAAVTATDIASPVSPPHDDILPEPSRKRARSQPGSQPASPSSPAMPHKRRPVDFSFSIALDQELSASSPGLSSHPDEEVNQEMDCLKQEMDSIEQDIDTPEQVSDNSSQVSDKPASSQEPLAAAAATAATAATPTDQPASLEAAPVLQATPVLQVSPIIQAEEAPTTASTPLPPSHQPILVRSPSPTASYISSFSMDAEVDDNAEPPTDEAVFAVTHRDRNAEEVHRALLRFAAIRDRRNAERDARRPLVQRPIRMRRRNDFIIQQAAIHVQALIQGELPPPPEEEEDKSDDEENAGGAQAANGPV